MTPLRIRTRIDADGVAIISTHGQIDLTNSGDLAAAMTTALATNATTHVIDWELVALQRRLAPLLDRDLRDAIRATFLTRLCAPDRDTAFYVGNQAKCPRTFSVLGIYWPPHR